MKIKIPYQSYDKKYDIFSAQWGKNRTQESAQLFDGKIIIDFDKNMDVVGIEIFNFMKELKEHDKKMEKIFKLKGVSPPMTEVKDIRNTDIL